MQDIKHDLYNRLFHSYDVLILPDFQSLTLLTMLLKPQVSVVIKKHAKSL